MVSSLCCLKMGNNADVFFFKSKNIWICFDSEKNEQHKTNFVFWRKIGLKSGEQYICQIIDRIQFIICILQSL